jgi:hypothetical protein
MSLLEEKLTLRLKESIKPSWVSDKNSTLAVYEKLIELKEQKIVSVHLLKISDLKIKKNYQISAGDLSRATNIAKTTLISTSSYSKDLKSFLEKVNDEIATIRNNRVLGYEANQKSVKQRKKIVIVDENKELKKAYELLLKANAADQAKIYLNNLSLPIKTKLGIK